MCFITENVRHRQKKPSFPLKGTYLCNLFYLAAQKTAPVVKSFHVLQVMMSHKVFSCKLTINPFSLREKCPKVFRIFPHSEKYSVFLRTQSECWKIRTRKNSIFGHFSRSVYVDFITKWDKCYYKLV